MAGPDKSSTLQRIERLERLEQERLEHQEQLRRRRDETLERARGEETVRHRALDSYEHRAGLPMAVLGLVWGVLAAVVLTADLEGTPPEVLVVIVFALWAAMAVEYMARLMVVDDRRRYLSSRGLEPATLALPILQVLRAFGTERSSLVAGELGLRTVAILRHRGLFQVLLAAAELLFLGSWLVLLSEEHASGSCSSGWASARRSWPSRSWSFSSRGEVGWVDPLPDCGEPA